MAAIITWNSGMVAGVVDRMSQGLDALLELVDRARRENSVMYAVVYDTWLFAGMPKAITGGFGVVINRRLSYFVEYINFFELGDALQAAEE